MRKYQDLALDFADAALMHIADRDDIDTVFTSTDAISTFIKRQKDAR